MQTSESAHEQKTDAPSLQRQTSEPAVPRGRHTRSEVEAVRLWGAETAAGRQSLVQTEAGSSAEAEVQETREDHLFEVTEQMLRKVVAELADLDEAESCVVDGVLQESIEELQELESSAYCTNKLARVTRAENVDGHVTRAAGQCSY